MKLTLSKKVSVFAILLLISVFQALAEPAQNDNAVSPGEEEFLLPAVLTPWGRFGEDYAEGLVDLMLPLYYDESSGVMFFTDFRGAYNDLSEQELNIGLGYRQLLESYNTILGLNVFYDARWTENDSQFNQLGVGGEILTPWVDARMNGYLPEDSKELISSVNETYESGSVSTTTLSGEYASGNGIYFNESTRTVTTFTQNSYEFYDVPLEGFDMELGVKLPIPADWIEARVFGGYYAFEPVWEGDTVDDNDISGFKGRAEFRIHENFFIDAEVFEDDRLFGSDYLISTRLRLPFDLAAISRGENPFRSQSAPTGSSRSRLTDMVMRDPHIQIRQETGVTTDSWEETTEKSVAHALLEEVIFVDGDNANDPQEDGTAEHPFDQIQEGVDSSAARNLPNVFVDHASTPYVENVEVARGIQFYGGDVDLGKEFNKGREGKPTVQTAGEGAYLFNFKGGTHALLAGFILDGAASGKGQVPLVGGAMFENVSDVIVTQNTFQNLPAAVLVKYTYVEEDEYDMLTVRPKNYFTSVDENTLHPHTLAMMKDPSIAPIPIFDSDSRRMLISPYLGIYRPDYNHILTGDAQFPGDKELFRVDIMDNKFYRNGIAIGGDIGSNGSLWVVENTIHDSVMGIGIQGKGRLKSLRSVMYQNRILNEGLWGDREFSLVQDRLSGVLPFSISESEVLPVNTGIYIGFDQGGEATYLLRDNLIQGALRGVTVKAVNTGILKVEARGNKIRGSGLKELAARLEGNAFGDHLSLFPGIHLPDFQEPLLSGFSRQGDEGLDLLSLLDLSAIMDDAVFRPANELVGAKDAGITGIGAIVEYQRGISLNTGIRALYNEINGYLIGASAVAANTGIYSNNNTKVYSSFSDNHIQGRGFGIFESPILKDQRPELPNANPGLAGIYVNSGRLIRSHHRIAYNRISDELFGATVLGMDDSGIRFIDYIGNTVQNYGATGLLGVSMIGNFPRNSHKDFEAYSNKLYGGGPRNPWDLNFGTLTLDDDKAFVGIGVLNVDSELDKMVVSRNQIENNAYGLLQYSKDGQYNSWYVSDNQYFGNNVDQELEPSTILTNSGFRNIPTYTHP